MKTIDQKIARDVLAEVREHDDNAAVVIIHLALMSAELNGYKAAVSDGEEDAPEWGNTNQSMERQD